MIAKNPITLRTPFMVKEFDSLDLFVRTVFPDIESYLSDKSSSNLSRSDLETLTYHELEVRFKIFIVRNYSDLLDKYLRKEAKHADKEAMKELLLSTISTTFNVVDTDNHKLNKSDYFVSFRNIINKIHI
jgi:IS4 transposase